MPLVPVRHATGSYDVLIEPGCLARLSSLVTTALGRGTMVVITDETVAGYSEQWKVDLGAESVRLTFPAGEASKNRATWARLSDEMLARGLDRDSGVVALGGGVVGDLAGFIAATFLRGIPYVQAPTTLLAMVDASVGGKVGVDTKHGKNLIGAFHPPALVLADPTTLATLPEPIFRSGLAETVKHGLIADPDYFSWIERHVAQITARDLNALTELVHRSVIIKAEVVSADEREGGRRAILNAGHTLAHGLEHESGFELAHGEAVALGLIGETAIAERLGLAPAGLAERVERLLRALGLPTRLRGPIDESRVLAAMQHDKKNRSGQVRMALPVSLGQMHQGEGRWTVAVPADQLMTALAQLR